MDNSMEKLSSLHAAIALWSLATMLLIQATVNGSYFTAIWALMLGQVAAVITCAAIVTQARQRVEAVVASEEEAVDRFAGAVLSTIGDQPKRPR